MADRRRWPPEKIEAIRLELERGSTLLELAAREGVSRQWIHQLVGPLGRDRSWKAKARTHQMRQRIYELTQQGLSDQDIARMVQLRTETVRCHRRQTGLLRPRVSRKWTHELIIKSAQVWYAQYGYLASTDWSPAQAIRQSHPERAARFYQFGAPSLAIVVRRFGSWSEMKRQAGLSPSPVGSPARGRWKLMP